jgi:hypothetical protein
VTKVHDFCGTYRKTGQKVDTQISSILGTQKNAPRVFPKHLNTIINMLYLKKKKCNLKMPGLILLFVFFLFWPFKLKTCMAFVERIFYCQIDHYLHHYLQFFKLSFNFPLIKKKIINTCILWGKKFCKSDYIGGIHVWSFSNV